MTHPISQPPPLSQTHSPSQPQPQAQQPSPLFQSPAPVFKSLPQYIQAAASGNRDSLFHLVVAIFSAARAALRSITQHYQSSPHALTRDHLARIQYCTTRLHAIFHTLTHAPERFLSYAQLRALTRAQAVLAHIWRQPVDFSPLVPFLTSPEACPPTPRAPHFALPSSAPSSSSSESGPSSPPSAPLSALRTPRSALPASDPLLLRSPGRALASVLLHLAAIYGLSTTPRAPLRAPHSSAPAPSASPAHQSVISNSSSTLPAAPHAPSSVSPHSTLRAPHFPHRPPP